MCLPVWVRAVLSALFFAVKQYVRVFDGGKSVVDCPLGYLNVKVQHKEAKYMFIYVYVM